MSDYFHVDIKSTLKFSKAIIFVYVLVPKCIYVHYMYARNHRCQNKMTGPLELSCELSYGCWELNLDALTRAVGTFHC